MASPGLCFLTTWQLGSMSQAEAVLPPMIQPRKSCGITSTSSCWWRHLHKFTPLQGEGREIPTHTFHGGLSMSQCKTSLWNGTYIDTATLGKCFLPQSPSVIPRLRRFLSTRSPSTQLLQFSCSNSLCTYPSMYTHPQWVPDTL